MVDLENTADLTRAWPSSPKARFIFFIFYHPRGEKVSFDRMITLCRSGYSDTAEPTFQVAFVYGMHAITLYPCWVIVTHTLQCVCSMSAVCSLDGERGLVSLVGDC